MTFKEHDCDSLPKSGAYIYIEDDDPAWTLNIIKDMKTHFFKTKVLKAFFLL